MSETVEVVTTGPADAMPGLVKTLVQERLVACAQLVRIESVYWWDGEVQQDPETRAVLHTTSERVDAVEARIAELHPYDVPAVLTFPAAQVNEPYGQWVREETGPTQP